MHQEIKSRELHCPARFLTSVKNMFFYTLILAIFLISPSFSLTKDDEDFTKAYSQYKNGKLSESQTMFETLAANANFRLSDYALYGVGECRAANKDYAGAITVFQSIIERYPDSSLADLSNYKIARCNFWRKDYSLAKKQFEALLKVSMPENIREDSISTLNEINKMKGLPIIKQETDKSTPRIKRTSDQINLLIGIDYYKRGKIKTATKYFKQIAAQKRSTAPAATYYLALCYLRSGKLTLGLKTLKEVSSRWPESDWAESAQYQIGLFYEEDGKNEEAVDAYKELFKKYPRSLRIEELARRLGVAAFKAGHYQEAYDYFQKALQSPEDSAGTPRNLYWIARSAYKLGREDEAISIFKKIITQYDHSFYAYRSMIKLNELEVSFDLPEISTADTTFDGPPISKDDPTFKEVLGIWQELRAKSGTPVPTSPGWEKSESFTKFKELISMGVYPYAAIEARALTHQYGSGFGQYLFGRMLMTMGENRLPLRQAENTLLTSIANGTVSGLPSYFWSYAYPIPDEYWYRVKFYADYFKVDPFLILAVIREESRFAADAKSHVGARGLMQVMPRTGRAIAKQLGISPFKTSDLNDPNINIGMGSYYLSQTLKRFYNRPELALAGYNGGPNRVSKWLLLAGDPTDVDLFIESIHLRETSYYVRRVMTSYYEYRRLYEGKIGS
jgi:soluble lytic murein transglycosylase-like protein/TolA-binding protein